MKKVVPVLVILGATGLLPFAGPASASPASLAGLAPAAVVSLAMAAARHEGSCLDVSKGAAVGYTFDATTQSGSDEAHQEMSFNSSRGTAVLIKGKFYIRESATLISLQFGKNDPQWANKWISIPRSSADYHSLATGLVFSSMISQVPPVAPLRTATTTLEGHRVVAVLGTANAELGLTKGVETLFVSATAPFLPVQLRASGRTQGVPTTLVVSFSHWGQHYSFTTPAGATPLASTTLP